MCTKILHCVMFFQPGYTMHQCMNLKDYKPKYKKEACCVYVNEILTLGVGMPMAAHVDSTSRAWQLVVEKLNLYLLVHRCFHTFFE